MVACRLLAPGAGCARSVCVLPAQLPCPCAQLPVCGPARPAQVLRQASEGVFVPLTVGGGIREFTDSNGVYYSALEVAAEYFRCRTAGGGRVAAAPQAPG